MAEEPLSSVDIRILEQIQKDSSLSTSDLADRVGLSQSPCWRRLQRLKDEGYIKGQVALLDRHKFGASLMLFAYLKMTTLTDEKRAEFLRKIEATPEILECHSLFGEKDIMLKVVAPSMEWYQKFIFNVILKLPGVVDIQSTVTLSELKSTTAIPLRGAKAL
ncbi:Lrp/AsnC family transcriptional regulator [Asticcacaulis machinosus]|uniref:Lrp/AsnC family transcriptional regulator n=1 Tax=Asticcacaulis machinosus TaxID=2984211 RepID=A0ABT5HN98_9CAUL|nr:Lrp/AsnC family transcriptional regulator [Asticcacaulis machinosus]MDC7677722.1 Lrp/AsnC family transcriptional regulator [Asticcacaulis machinosus]